MRCCIGRFDRHRKRSRLIWISICALLICFWLSSKILGLQSYIYNTLHGDLECFASKRTKASIRHMVLSYDIVMSQLNLTHWIDFGTLLGQQRYKDVVPWDHDGDVAYLRQDFVSFRDIAVPLLIHNHNISINANNPVQMTFRDVQVDVFSYATYAELRLPLPQVKTQRTLTRATYRNSDFVESFADVEPELVLPTKLCPFSTSAVQCPNEPDLVLRSRYRYSYGYRLSYKLQCYLKPWNLVKLYLYS